MKINTIENAEEALSIVDKVCKKYIPNKFQLEIVEEEEDETLLVLSFPKLNAAVAWDLNDEILNETILMLEAHGICGAVLRYEAGESSDSFAKVLRASHVSHKGRIYRFSQGPSCGRLK